MLRVAGTLDLGLWLKEINQIRTLKIKKALLAVHIAELIESLIIDEHFCKIGIDCAKWIVFCRDVQAREQVESCRLSNIWKTNNSHL